MSGTVESTGDCIARVEAKARVEERARVAALDTFFIHSGGGTPDGPHMIRSAATATHNLRLSWGEPDRCYLGVPHNNANRRKKSKRKQAQASRRNNRR